MAKASWIVPAFLFGCQLSTGAMAADTSSCDQLQRTCGEAGFTRDVPGGRDLMEKCYRPLLNGQDVPGVKADPDLVKKCNEQAKPKHGRRRSG